VRLLANPIIMRMGLALLVSLAAFVAGILCIRALRRELVEGESLTEDLSENNDASYAYSAVIQNLKQQKFELQSEHTAQKRRAKTAEQITAAVITNLPCGVLFIGPNGLVKQANAAARQLLGFASPLGMGPDDLFRDAVAIPESGEPELLADAVRASLRAGVRASVRSAYQTATGEQRELSLTLIPLGQDEASGLACVIADDTPVEHLKRGEALRSEVSAEMALQLRNSLSVIRDCATRIAVADQQDVISLANDITAEIDQLDRVVGGFLAEPSATKAATASV
jgi:nitrogen fixation/metabolism regulation signal transduction histidine kinase